MGNKKYFTLLALVLVTCSVGEVRCGIIGERGSSLQLNPHTRGKLEQVTWTHNGKKVVEYDQQQILIFDPFKKRVVLDLHTGELTIKRLNTGDDGLYESFVLVDGKDQYSKHNLQVIDTVPQPKVTCKKADPESEETTLLCGVDSDTPVRFRWRGPTVYDQPGSELQLGKQEDLDSVFTCIVKNEISEKYATFTPRDCQKDGISPGIIAAVILCAICALCLLILIPLVLVYRRKQKKNLRTKNQPCKQEDIENGESKNLLSPGESTCNDTDEGGKKKKQKGLFRAVHNKKRGSGLDSDERTSFSLRATLPSQAKLQHPRVRHEQANGTCEAKEVNGLDQSTAIVLQHVDQSAEKLLPESVELATSDQKLPLSAEKPEMQLTTGQDIDQSMDKDEELPHGSPVSVVEGMKPYCSHNVTVTIERRDRRESCEEEENVSDTERGADPMSESGAEEEKVVNRPQTDMENCQVEEDQKQKKAGEDMHVQENHEVLVEESSVDKKRNGEEVHPDQTEEEEADISALTVELPDTEQGLQEQQKEDTPIVEKESEQDTSDEAEIDSETESIGKEGNSVPVQERGRTAVEEEEDITTQEQTLRESEQEPQEKVELAVLQSQDGDREEEKPHTNESLNEERNRDGEDGKLDPEDKKHDGTGRGREMESAVEQGVDEEVNTNKKREENNLRHEDKCEPDEDTVSGNSEQEDQFTVEAPDTSAEKQIDCQDASVTNEMNVGESVIKSVSEGTEMNTPEVDKKQEEQSPLKEGEDQSTSTEKTVATEDQDNCLPKDHDKMTDEESNIKSEHERMESNTQLEEKSQEEQDPVRQTDNNIPQEEPVALEEQSQLPGDQRSDQVISDYETQDNQDRKKENTNMNNHDQVKDFLDKEIKQEHAKPDQQQNDTNSPEVYENKPSTPAKKDEERAESETSTHLEEKTQEQDTTGQGGDDNTPKEEPVVVEAGDLLHEDQRTDKVTSDDGQDQDRQMESMNNHNQAKDSLQEQEFKQEQAEPDQQHNDTNSPVVHENGASPLEKGYEEIEQKNEQSLAEQREESELPKTECAEKTMDPSIEPQNKEQSEEGGEEEERGQIDSTQSQDQPLKEEQLTDINMEERQGDKTGITGEKENELDPQTSDTHLAKEKNEGEAQIAEEYELKKGEVGEVATDKVQEDPAEGNERVIAVNEKEDNGTKDPMTENVDDLSETEKLYPTKEIDVDQRQDGTQKDGQKDNLNSRTSDENINKMDEKDNEMKGNSEPVKEALEEERGDTKVPQEKMDEVSGQQHNEQSQVEQHGNEEVKEDDEKQLTDGKEPVKGTEEEDEVEQGNGKKDSCENDKDGGAIVPEKNGDTNDSQSEKEGKEKVQIHQDNMGQSTKQVSEGSCLPSLAETIG